jgi:hypothetical protein
MRFPTPNIKIQQVFAPVDVDLAALLSLIAAPIFAQLPSAPLKIIITARPVKIPRTKLDRECRAEFIRQSPTNSRRAILTGSITRIAT